LQNQNLGVFFYSSVEPCNVSWENIKHIATLHVKDVYQIHVVKLTYELYKNKVPYILSMNSQYMFNLKSLSTLMNIVFVYIDVHSLCLH